MLIRTEMLGGGVCVLISAEHAFGTDAFLLSHFAAPRSGDQVCDLGCGCGIIPLLWYASPPAPARVDMADIQPRAVELARRSVAASGLAERISVYEADLRALPAAFGAGRYDLITCNPPYKTAGRGIPSRSDSGRIARHETLCTIGDVCAAAKRLLRFGGRLCVCQRVERLADVFEAMRAHAVEPKRLRFVQKNAANAPWLFLLEGRRGSGPFLRVEPPLLLEENGAMSGELRAVYARYAQEEPEYE